MSNPFEKYVQATFRQNEKLESAKVTLMDTTLQALAPNFDNITKPNTGKSAGDLLVDAAASALKIPTIIGGVAVGAADLALSAASKPIEGYMRIGNALAPSLIPEPMDVGYGYIAKGLHDTIGYRPEEAKAFIDEKLFSDARKIQEKEYQSGYTAAEDKAFQDIWTKDYQAQIANLQKAGATEQQLKDFSAGFDKQYQDAATKRADKYQTSWNKPLSENIDIIRHGFDNLLENPSLALGGAIESGGYLLPSMLVSRGVLALEKAANIAKIEKVAAATMAGRAASELAITRSPFLAAGVGEGSVSGLTVLEQMRSQMPDGIAGGRELLGALGVGASTGLIGAGFGKAASKVGIGDIDSVGLGRAASQVAAMKLPALARPVGAIAHEGAEEFSQTFGESIIPNVTMGKDPLEGLGQELPLGTLAGAIMGAGMNAPSLVSGGFSDISSGLGKVKEAASLKSFDTLSNPEHKNYNPAQAFNIQLKNLESNDETVRTQAEANVSKVETDLNTARATVDEQIKNINTALKSMPPIAQMTDAQKLEVDALAKARTELTAKSDKLTEHLIGFLEAQVTAQDHRDAQQGTQFTEEQAKADIATLTQPQTSTTVWSTAGGDVPVEVTGKAYTDDAGDLYLPVKYELQGEMVDASVPANEVTSQPATTDPIAQQEALDRVTKHFSKYSNDDLDLLATSPVFNEQQRNSLRLMSKSKRELAAVQDPSQVFDNILNGYKGKTIQESHRGLNQYTDMVNTAVATKNEQLASLALDGLGAFTQDHIAKRDAINEAFGLVQKGTYKEIRVVRTEDGTWGFVPFTAQEVRAGKNADGVVFLEGKALKEAMNKVGGFNVHINSDKNGAITQINNETQLIQDRFNALSGVAESFVGVTPKPVDTSTAPTIDTPVVTESSQRSPKLEEAYKETFSKPIENWDANDFASVGAQATHLGSTFDSKTIDADNAFSQKMAKKIIADGIAKNRSTADIMQDVMFVAYSSDFAMRQSGVDALRAYIELRKAQGTSTTPIVTKPSDTTAPVVNPAPEAPVQSAANTQNTVSVTTEGGIELTHNIPKSLVDVTRSLSEALEDLLQMTTQGVSTNTGYGIKLLRSISKRLPNTLVRIVSNLDLVEDKSIPAQLGAGGFYDTDNGIVYIYPNSIKWKSSALELLNHELIHAVTHGKLNATGLSQSVLSALDAIKSKLGDELVYNETWSDAIGSRIDYLVQQNTVDELLSVILAETNVYAALDGILTPEELAQIQDAFKNIYTTQNSEKLNEQGRQRDTSRRETAIPNDVSKPNTERAATVEGDSTTDSTSSRDNGSVQSNTSNAPTGTEQAEPVAPKDAKVTVLQGVTDEIAAAERKKPFNLRNILKGYFTQSTTKEDAVGANPLVTIKDFLKGLGTLTQVSDWLNDRRKPTLKQLAQVEHFKKFHAEFSKALNLVFNTQVAAKYVSNMENLVGYMEMGKKASTRKLDENVVTALALSAYSYLIKQGNKVMNTNEELETLFRLKKGVRAPLEIEQMFRFAGQEMPIVVKALGTDAAKALGLKVREDQDPTLQDRLNTSLGILAMEAMAKAGFVVIDTLEGKPLTDFLTAIKTVRESKAHTSEDEYDFEVDTDAETEISKFTMVRPNALMEGESKTVFDGNRPVLTEGLPTLNSPLVNELIEANKDTKGFLSYLFGVDVGLTTPLKEIPKKFTQRLINGTDASVPSVQAELLTEAQKHSFTMRTNTVAVFAAMQKLGENSQFLKELLGIWIDDHVLSRTHVTERDSLQAKAQNDWTAVLNGLEWADATLDENGQYQEFYDTQFVAQNQRQHLNSNMFSAQSSQIHRAMAALTGFSTTIDLTKDEQGTVKDEALLNLFYQAVGEGLEGLDDYLKADILSKAEAGLHQFFTVDKVYGDYYVPALKAFLQTTESKSAIKAMRALIETGTIDTTQQKAIAAFVDKGKMGAQSLQSLIALAELSIAQDSKEQIFTTTIGFGSDGVNHGVSAANMLTGVISKDMRQQTGIFPIAEKGQVQISNMQEVYKRKITDYYVDFGKVMSAKLRDLVGTLRGKLNTDFVQGMTALFPKFEVLDDTGELRDLLAMRKIAKIWAIPFNYSAGKAALQRALARGFLAGIYGNMNKLANEALDIIDAGRREGVTEEEKATLRLKLETVKLKTKTLEDNLNKVLRKYGMSVTLPAPQLLNEEAQGKLSKELENTLMQAAIDLYGEAAWQATEEFAKDYLEVRNVYTEVEKASFTLFDVVRNQLIEEKKASRKYTNVNAKVQVKGKTVQYTAEELNAQEAEYFGLTTVEIAEVDAALAAMRPIFNTALSIGSESTNDAGSTTNPSGVSVRKRKMQREPASGLRAVSTFYGTPRAESRNIGLTKEVEENAGVASSANAVQSIDAFVAAKVQAFMDALNVHDNAIFGLKDFLKGVKKQNEEHLKALTNYQLGLEHAKMLVRVYVGYKAFMATQEEALKSEDATIKENAQKLITKTKKQMEVLLWGEQMFKGDTALKINGETVYKGGLIPKLQAANLDIKDSASIEEAISVFINFALKQDLQKLEVLLDTYSIHQFAGEGGMHQLTKADKASIEKQKALVQKALLDLDTELNGKPAPMNTTEAVKPITELVKFLRKAKGAVIDITSLIEHLTNNTDINDLKARAAQLEVLKAITPLIDKATKVIYSEGDYDGYGYYDEETNTLHINSAKEAEGGVRSTLAVHELLHAALSSRIKTLNASIETKEAEAKKTGKEVSFTSAEVALRNLEKLRVNLVTPDGMRMLELRAELGSAIEDSAQFYKDTEELYESQKAENVSTIKELQALNKEEARITEIEGEIKKRGTSIGAAYKAQLEAELKTLTPKAELDTKRNALLTKQQAMRDTKALLDKANEYFELRETLSKKVLSERTRKDGSSSKFTQLNLVEMLTNIDEFISYGLTESRLQEAMKRTQVGRGGRTFSVKLRKFVEFVGQIFGFRTKEISALAAFASDTAALLETIGSVTPVVAPNKGERLFSTQSAEDQVNTKPEINTALEQARKAVRELLTQLNFKFVDSPDVNLSDIERIASKYLTEGKSNNDPAFLKDAATALSYAIYFELGLPQGNAKMREWLEQSLLDWLTTGEIPKLHKSVWVKAVEIFNKIMAAVSNKGERRYSKNTSSGNGLTVASTRQILVKQFGEKLIKALEAKGLLRIVETVGDIPSQALKSIQAWHGSPFKFNRFSLAHLGSGEGNQAYGWGLYFAASREVSEWYRTVLSEQQGKHRTHVTYDGIAYEFSEGSEHEAQALIRALVSKGHTFRDSLEALMELRKYPRLVEVRKAFTRIVDGDSTRYTEAEIAKEDKFTKEVILKPRRILKILNEMSIDEGQLYKVDIDVIEDGLLLWDVSFEEQPKVVQQALLALGYKPKAKTKYLSLEEDGGSIYRDLAGTLGGQKEASLALKKNGVDGIKYLDGGSRQAGEGNYNYVVFDDAAVDIVETFYSKNPNGIEGYYHNGQATLVAAGLTAKTVVATLLHELSGHKGFQELMEPAAYNALMKQFDKLVAEGNPIALAALKRAQEATGSDGKPLSLQGQMDEYLPYLLTIQAAINATQAQKSAIAKFIDNVFRAVRAWAYKKLQDNGYEDAASTFMQPQDIVYMAERMLREIANSSVTSGNPQSSIKFSTQSAEDLVNGQSSLDIMQALPHSNTGAFNQQLDRLIVEEIGQLYNQDDAAKARIDEIQTFTASDALNAGFTLSRKEQYVQQALQYAVAAYMKLHAGGANVGQLRRVYHAAKVKISPTGKDFHEGDWATATQQEKDIAKAKYDFMFDSTKEDYMSRFVSMALASEAVNKLLDIALPLNKPETQDKTWFETVSDWASYVMAWLTNKYVRLNPTLGASNQLVQLMDNLVKLDIRNRQEGVALHQKAWNTIGLVTTPLNSALKGAGGAVLSGVGLRESRFLPVRALGAILVLRSEEAAKAIPKMIIDMRNNQLPNTKLGEVANILLEASGVGTLRDKFDVLIRQTNLNAKNRQDIVDGVKKAVNKWFKEPLTKAQSKAVAYGLLGTDAQALLENYSVEDIVDMALHEGKLNVEIAKLKSEIAKNPNGNDTLNAAEQLGYYMVTRIGGEGLVKNALGIAIGLGTQYFTSVEQADPKLVGQLNTLVSMLAMTHVPNSDKAILAALYKTDAEGIHATIQLHQGLVNDSLKDFQANPLNMVKGWMPEVTNPYLEIKAANSMVERQQMEAEGWVLIDELKRDKHDKGSPKYLMKHNDIGYQRLVSGAVDLGSTARSGTEAISRTSPKYLGITQARYQNAARRAAIPNGSFDPSKQPRGLIAAYDTNGMPLAYNYEMDNETRDAHLDRKHNIGDLLGTFGGLNYYKPEKAKQSNKVAEVLFEDYKANYSQNPNAYLKISHKSTDPKVVEMWRMLPQDFKQRATELYGKGNPIIIRNEAFNLAFGFKKFSVVSYAFDAVKAERERIKNGLVGTGKSPNAFQSGFVRFAEATRKGTAQADFAKAEHVTQEIVKAIKDFIVIRSGTTMMWNIFANVLMLMANGINPVTIIKDWVFAVTNVRAYQKLNSQLIQAQADLAGGKDPIALKQRIGALKAELKANVMNPYINAGLLSSIVEDVNIQQGEYTYTSAFKQTVDAKTQWIPKPVKTAAAVLTIAPSTKLYQFLATTTQLSDFVAKYSMSKHLQANGTDIDASIIEASKTFINYDLPTSQGLQYANDMGLFMFTKFFLRIQAVLMKLLGKRAGSTIAQHILVESLTGAEGILSPIAYGHIGNNPLESSVLGLPSAFFGIGTIDAVTDFGVSF